MTTEIAALAFLLAWYVGAGGLLLGLAELAACAWMAPRWVFRWGPRLTIRGLPAVATLDVSRMTAARGTLGRLRYRKLDEHTWLLTDARPWSFGGAVPPLKATLTVTSDGPSLEPRASLGVTLFVGGWACGWVVGAASGAVAGSGSGPLAAVGTGVLGLAVAIILVWVGAAMAHRALAAALVELVDFDLEARRRPWMPR